MSLASAPDSGTDPTAHSGISPARSIRPSTIDQAVDSVEILTRPDRRRNHAPARGHPAAG